MHKSDCKIPGWLLFASLVILFYFTSCKKKENDYFFTIDVSPSFPTQSYQEGSIVNMIVKINSSETIRSLRVSEKRTNVPTKIVLDTLINNKINTTFWDYQVPVYSKESSTYYLDFDVIFSSGELSTKRFVFNILEKEVKLVEKSGFTVYSKKSGSPFGFDIAQLKPVYPDQITDKTSISFEDTSSSSKLSKVWISQAKGKFVKFNANSLDYANATMKNVVEAYNSGIKLELVNNLSVGDVVIYYNAGVTDYKLIKLTEVVDIDSTLNDKYVFNIKQRQ